MAWPTEAEVQAQFEKLNDALLLTKLTRAIAMAKNVILSTLAGYYDVSTFLSSPPPLLYDLALYMTYGYFAPRVHTGSKTSATDDAAKDAREYADTLLEKLAKGELLLVDSSGVLIARRGDGTGYVSRRTDGSVFGPGEPETWAVALLAPGDEMT